jgi:hypothetical protein
MFGADRCPSGRGITTLSKKASGDTKLPPERGLCSLVHQRSQQKQQERDFKREQKHAGWTFIHSYRTEPDGHIKNNSWHDDVIGETVDIVEANVVLAHLETVYPMKVLPSVYRYFSEIPRGLVIQAQFKV